MFRIYNRAIVFLLFTPCMYAMDVAVISREIAKEGSFYELPLEVHSKIIKNIFSLIIREDGDSDEHRAVVNKCFDRIVITEHIDPQKLDKYVLRTPMPLGVALTYQFHQLQKLCEKQIGGKDFTARDLFVLPHKERDVFMRIANRGYVKYVCEGDLSDDDYRIIESIEKQEIKKGLQLRLLDGNKITSYARSIGIGGTCGVFALICVAWIFNVKNPYLCYFIFGFKLSSLSVFGVSILLEMCGYSACIKQKCF